MASFKNVSKNKLGYEPTEVDAFILRARDHYNNVSAQLVDWRDLTDHKFALTKGGYDIRAVDAAIDKLQDTFAERELSKKSNPFAASFSGSILTELRGLLLSRANRPKNHYFKRVNVFGVGYSRKEVNALMEVVQEFLEGEEILTLEDVRSLRFKVKRGGYIESQVDAYIGRLVEYLETQRYSEPIVVTAVESQFSGFSSGGPIEGTEPPASNDPYSHY